METESKGQPAYTGLPEKWLLKCYLYVAAVTLQTASRQ